MKRDMIYAETSRPRNDHNVYILGAGFSAEAGLPLIKDFMNRMRDAAVWLEEQDGREREIAAIARALSQKASVDQCDRRQSENAGGLRDKLPSTSDSVFSARAERNNLLPA